MWLREQRERRGFSAAAELGRAIGASKEVVWSYEAGRSSVPDDRAEQIAEALGMDLVEVRRNLGLWVPPETEPDPDVRSAVAEDEAWMDEQYEAWKQDRDRKAALKALFKTGADHRDVV